MRSARHVVIVGAGVTGLLTAVECALAGHRVTVLDRGAIPNPGSSSFDHYRAIRTFALGDPAATRQKVAAHRRWLELETTLGARFYRRVGIVTAWPGDEADTVVKEATAAGLPVSTVEPEKLPHLGFPAGSIGVIEADAGVLLADQVLSAAVNWLAAHPAVTLRPWSEVTSVHSGRIELEGSAPLDADVVLVAAGPWVPDLVELPAVLHRQTMVYLRPPENLVRWWQTAPGGGHLGVDGRAWLLPPGDGQTLVKISSDAVCREVDSTDSADESQDPWLERLLASSIVSDVDCYTVVATKSCHYLSDANAGDTLLTRAGPAVWARAACGGTGFTTAPLVARQFVKTLTEETA
jgi:glycine/D-amino acid oxidase-like deaminating enzyme